MRPSAHIALFLATLGSLALAGGLSWVGDVPGHEAIEWLLALAASTPGGLFAGAAAFVIDPAPFLFAGLHVLSAGLPYALGVAAVMGAHEMGHYLACRWYGVAATLPFFIPGVPPIGSFGAVIRMRGRVPHRRALFDVAAAGPLAGFAVTLPLAAWGLSRAEPAVLPQGAGAEGIAFGTPWLFDLLPTRLAPEVMAQSNAFIGAAWVGVLVTSLNLFPVGQLDGGHVAYALSRRFHRWTSRLTPLALLGLIAYQVLVRHDFPPYLVWLVVLGWMRDRHPPLLDEGSRLGPVRRAVALLLAAVFVLSFIPAPLTRIGTDAPPGTAGGHPDQAVEIRAPHVRADGVQPLERLSMRVAEGVAQAARQRGDARLHLPEELERRAAAAPVMGHDQRLGTDPLPTIEQESFTRGAEVSGNEDPRRSSAGKQHDRALVRPERLAAAIGVEHRQGQAGPLRHVTAFGQHERGPSSSRQLRQLA